MDSHVTVEPLCTVPDDVRVAHYDELDGDAQRQFLELVDAGGERAERVASQTALPDVDVVKFTQYYRIQSA